MSLSAHDTKYDPEDGDYFEQALVKTRRPRKRVRHGLLARNFKRIPVDQAGAQPMGDDGYVEETNAIFEGDMLYMLHAGGDHRHPSY